jgi:chromosome segregation ATPase
MFDSVKKSLHDAAVKADLWKDDTPSAAPEMHTPAAAPKVFSGPDGYSPDVNLSPSTILPQSSDELMAALEMAMNNRTPNNAVLKLFTMADSMKSAIGDEGTRLAASSAATGMKQSELLSTVDILQSNLEGESLKFHQNDVVRMNGMIEQSQKDLEIVEAHINELATQLSEASTKKSELTQQIATQQAETSNKINVFEATIEKIKSNLDVTRTKIKAFVKEV